MCVRGEGEGAAQGMDCKITTYFVHLGTWSQHKMLSHIHLNGNNSTQTSVLRASNDLLRFKNLAVPRKIYCLPFVVGDVWIAKEGHIET